MAVLEISGPGGQLLPAFSPERLGKMGSYGTMQMINSAVTRRQR
jgi:hypothetical protein